jgi:hypothetical protein
MIFPLMLHQILLPEKTLSSNLEAPFISTWEWAFIVIVADIIREFGPGVE